MDTSVKCLTNSISRFVHLVSCQTTKIMPIQKNFNDVASCLKPLKPLLDEVVDYQIHLDGDFYKECEELDTAINEARELMENWCPKMSKIHTVLQSKTVLMRVQSSSLEICYLISKSLKSSPYTSVLNVIQDCMQEIQCVMLEPVAIYIDEALTSQGENSKPLDEHLMKVTELLGLSSNQELFKESVSVEKEWMHAEVHNMKEKLDEINQIMHLISNIRDCAMKVECYVPNSSIVIPSYFRCPLSLELMLDPVIVASGQTYERSSIQKWLDNGLTLCPRTRQKLTHANLIPNYTVKAMIANWCEENNIKLPINSAPVKTIPVACPSDPLSPQDLIQTSSFHSSLNSSNLTSRSSIHAGNEPQKQKDDISLRLSGESNGCQSGDAIKFDQPSSAPAYSHSRSESVSSSISITDTAVPPSNELSNLSTRDKKNYLSKEVMPDCPADSPLDKEPGFHPCLSEKHFQNSETKVDRTDDKRYNHSRALSIPLSGSGSDDSTTPSHVMSLIEALNSQDYEVQTMAAEELRFLAKYNMENRVIIGECGAIKPLLSLLYSEVKLMQEHAVTALLNLSINEDNKSIIAEAGAIEPLIHVLRTGSDVAKENSAAALFSLSVLEKYKAIIGRSEATKALVVLLGSGTLRGKKDAATALFNLSIYHENKARIVQAGAVEYLVQFLDPVSGMVDKAVALLANLSTVKEGCYAVAKEGGIPLLVELVESGSQRGKENAASVLLQLCLYSPKFCTLVLQEGAVPPLVALSQSGTPRAREKAQQLLSHFRNQREGGSGKGKS